MMQHDRIKASTLDMAGPYQIVQDQNFNTITENQENHSHQQNLYLYESSRPTHGCSLGQGR